jgi:uncharacterized protein with HEPN domain
MSERNTVVLLEDVANAIQNIFDFTKNLSFEDYSNDIKTRHAVEHNFMIIGEAVSRLSEDFKKQHTDISWREVKIFGMLLFTIILVSITTLFGILFSKACQIYCRMFLKY